MLILVGGIGPCQTNSTKLLLETICGDGLVVGSEGCDDANLDTVAGLRDVVVTPGSFHE